MRKSILIALLLCLGWIPLALAQDSESEKEKCKKSMTLKARVDCINSARKAEIITEELGSTGGSGTLFPSEFQ